MAHTRDTPDLAPHGVLRAGRAAGRRGHDDERPVPVTDRRVTLYHAPDCHLCERALEVVREAQGELGFELELVDVTDSPELEARYREHLPVVEIGGERAFTYFVDAHALRGRLS